jgi:hypothetical protein
MDVRMEVEVDSSLQSILLQWTQVSIVPIIASTNATWLLHGLQPILRICFGISGYEGSGENADFSISSNSGRIEGSGWHARPARDLQQTTDRQAEVPECCSCLRIRQTAFLVTIFIPSSVTSTRQIEFKSTH